MHPHRSTNPARWARGSAVVNSLSRTALGERPHRKVPHLKRSRRPRDWRHRLHELINGDLARVAHLPGWHSRRTISLPALRFMAEPDDGGER